MKHTTNPICDICKEKQESFKFLKKLKKDGKTIYMCKECYIKNRNKRRNNNEERKKIERENHNELQREYAKRKYRESKNGNVREYKKRNKEEQLIPKRYRDIKTIPEIKGTDKPKIKSNSYLTLQESQILLRKLMKINGLDFEEAKERIENLKQSLKEERIKHKEEGKSEEEFKLNKQRMLEELWRS